MNSKKILIVLILVFVILLGGAYTLYNKLGADMTTEQLAVQATPVPTAAQEEAPEAEAEAESDAAPDFTVYDAEGNAVKLSDYAGKPVVLNFWASWCGPCQMEMPDFDEKYGQLGDEVQFLMVNMTDGSRETVETASAFIAEKGYSFPVFYDTSGEAAYTYMAFSLPTTYFIDAQGQALARATGAIDADTLQKGIDLIYPQ